MGLSLIHPCLHEGVLKPALEMEPEDEGLDTSDNLLPWSGSDASQELCLSESLAESYTQDDDCEEEYPLESQSPHTPKSGTDSPECLQLHDWESAGKQDSPPGHNEIKICLCGSIEMIKEPHLMHALQLSMSSFTEPPDSEPHVHQTLWQHSRSSSSSSVGCADMTQALTLPSEQPQGTRNRQGPETGNRRVDSSEEGGSSEAPPASVSFGISDECAEQAEKRNSGSDTDLCRPDRHRARHTRKYPFSSPFICSEASNALLTAYSAGLFLSTYYHAYFFNRSVACFVQPLTYKLISVKHLDHCFVYVSSVTIM